MGTISSTISSLDVFFKPSSVAIVGASSDPKKPGCTALKNLVSMGFQGKIYPINPREDSILGFNCFKSILDIPEPVELCVLLVSADLTMKVAQELVERKNRFNDVTGAICMSAGFGELGTDEGKQREKELVRILNSASIRLIGPNCVGMIDAYSGFNTSFDIPSYPTGGLSFLTQSGALATSFLFWAKGLRLVGLSKFASIGNMADVDMSELLMFLKDDDSTKVIGIYMEGLPNPREFFETAREVSAIKPIVVLKAGKSDIGTAAALSHTGAIAGSDAIYEGAFRQAGIIRARSVMEFYDLMRVFERQPIPEGNRVSVLTHMGGPGTLCIDEISASSTLQMARFSPDTESAIKSICAPMANVGHPDGYIDLTAAHTEKLHGQVLEHLFNEPGVDIVLQILAPSAFLDQKMLVEEISRACDSQTGRKKTFLNAVTFGSFAFEARQGLEDAGFPTVEYSDALARVAGKMAEYAAFCRSVHEKKQTAGDRKTSDAVISATSDLIATAAEKNQAGLLEPEAYEICKNYGIPTSPYSVVDTLEAGIDTVRQIGYPVVLKVVSAEIIHKSDIGGVVLGINSDEMFRQGYEKLTRNVQAAYPHIQQPMVLIQKMMPATTELVIGALRDKLFGPVVMFGLGGIFVEALKLVNFRLLPISVEDAGDLIRQTLPPALLEGIRGRAAINVDSLASIVVSLGRLLDEQPQIEEVDLNPTLPYENGCVAVDARIIINRTR
jgi:acetate---CoA ligase (ADP-forming)